MLAFKTHAQASPARRDSAAWGREESNCQRGKWKYSARIGPRKRRASSLREVACIRYEKQSRAPDRGEARRGEARDRPQPWKAVKRTTRGSAFRKRHLSLAPVNILSCNTKQDNTRPTTIPQSTSTIQIEVRLLPRLSECRVSI